MSQLQKILGATAVLFAIGLAAALFYIFSKGDSEVKSDAQLANSCVYTEWVGDGICDELANAPECNYDGNDCFCCNNPSNKCICLISASSGNGVTTTTTQTTTTTSSMAFIDASCLFSSSPCWFDNVRNYD